MKSFQWGEPQQYTSVIFVRQKWSEHWQMSWLVGQRPEQSKTGRLKSKFLIGRQSDSKDLGKECGRWNYECGHKGFMIITVSARKHPQQ